jgi:hypothetical protein
MGGTGRRSWRKRKRERRKMDVCTKRRRHIVAEREVWPVNEGRPIK